MKVYFELESIAKDPMLQSDETAVALGTFDGVHLGHQAVLNTMKEEAARRKLKTFVYTFSNHPKDYLAPETAPTKIMDVEEKVQILTGIGFDYLALLKFDQDQMRRKPEDFVREVIVKMIGARHVVVGHDFTFGAGASGRADALPEYGRRFGFGVTILEPVTYQGERISSTMIRDCLSSGRIREANTLLGRTHFIHGQVVEEADEERLGIRILGIDSGKLAYTFKTGVYFTRVQVGGELFDSITNIGYFSVCEPDLGDGKVIRMETHIFGCGQKLPGSKVRVFFERFYRNEIRFASSDELRLQIEKDLEAARSHFDLQRRQTVL